MYAVIEITKVVTVQVIGGPEGKKRVDIYPNI
jgi:hypothetical protein